MPEREDLAREILDKALKLWGGRMHKGQSLLKVLAPNGSTWPLYTIKCQGLGQIVYHYVPARLVESIIIHCERTFDAREGLRMWPEEDRTGTIKSMATNATARLLLDLPARLSDALQTAFEESLLYTEAALEGSIAHTTGGIIDSTAAINGLVSITSERQRQRLSSNLKRIHLSEVFTPIDDRRLPKITIGRLKLAYKTAKKNTEEGEKVQQRTVAKNFRGGISTKQLRRWCEKELGLTKWDEVLDYLEGT